MSYTLRCMDCGTTIEFVEIEPHHVIRPETCAACKRRPLTPYRSVHCVYFIGEQNPSTIKIGWAKNPWTRLKELQRGNSRELEVWGCYAGSRHDEAREHRDWADIRLDGEWFQGTRELLFYIRRVCPVSVLIKHRFSKTRKRDDLLRELQDPDADLPGWINAWRKSRFETLPDDTVGEIDAPCEAPEALIRKVEREAKRRLEVVK